ncbi:hypothetical protein SLA2020_288800 [Shorea laevis]
MVLKNAVAIGKSLGNLLEVENADSLSLICRSYLRILVEIDIRKPLEPGSIIHREVGPPICIQLKYERLDDYCVACGLIGHKKSDCSSDQPPLPPDRYKVSLKAIHSYRFWAAPPRGRYSRDAPITSETSILKSKLDGESTRPQAQLTNSTSPNHITYPHACKTIVHSPHLLQ